MKDKKQTLDRYITACKEYVKKPSEALSEELESLAWVLAGVYGMDDAEVDEIGIQAMREVR